jgi:hypothetical protein
VVFSFGVIAVLKTVNVIWVSDKSVVDKLASFPDDKDGNSQAEELFLKWAKESSPGIENVMTPDEFEDCLMDGQFYVAGSSPEESQSYILIVHSTES